MPKGAQPKRVNWRLGVAILAGLLLFVSTAMATRHVQYMLRSNDRFFLASVTDTGAPGIRIEGNHYTSRDRIALIFALDMDRSVFSIPLDERRRRLLAIDWVEDAAVMRIWPNQLIVKVRERRPIAFAKLPTGTSGQFHYLLIDAEGVLLSVPRQRFDFPVLTGVTEDQAEEDRRVRVLSMRHLLRDLGTPASSGISEINATSPQDMRVSAKIKGHPVELWLGDRNFLARYQNFTNHFEEIEQQSEGATVFDLRLDDRIMTVR